MKKLFFSALIVAAAVLGVHQITAQGFGKMDRELFLSLQADTGKETYDVLVKLKETANIEFTKRIADRHQRAWAIYDTLRYTALSSQSDILDLLKANDVYTRPFYIVNMIYAEGLSADLIHQLAARKDVEKIYSDLDIPLQQPPVDSLAPLRLDLQNQSGVQFVQAEKVWSDYGVKGAGIVVAGQDTGVEWDHPSLKNTYRGYGKLGQIGHNYNWYDGIQKPITGGSSCQYASELPCDDHGHGTHTVGTMVGYDGEANKIGVAPEAQWIACRNMDAGNGRPHSYMACFEFFLAPFPTDGDPLKDGRPDLAPHVMNNSWGCPLSEKCKGDILLEILQVLKTAGMMVVVSAGNDGPSCKTIQDTPAWHSADTFSVGAYDHRRQTIASFSSRGPSLFDGAIGPDIVAPGVNIKSAVPGGKYAQLGWSGTSMAGPHVAGVVALMWSAQPSLIGQIDETIDLLIQTARPVPSSGCMSSGQAEVPNNHYGHGIVDAYQAVKAALAR